MEGLSPSKERDGLTLIGEPNGEDFFGMEACPLEAGFDSALYGRPNLFRIMLHPAGLRVMLRDSKSRLSFDSSFKI